MSGVNQISQTIGDVFGVLACSKDHHYYKLIGIRLNPSYQDTCDRVIENATKLIIASFKFDDIETLHINRRSREILIGFRKSGIVSLRL